MVQFIFYAALQKPAVRSKLRRLGRPWNLITASHRSSRKFLINVVCFFCRVLQRCYILLKNFVVRIVSELGHQIELNHPFTRITGYVFAFKKVRAYYFILRKTAPDNKRWRVSSGLMCFSRTLCTPDPMVLFIYFSRHWIKAFIGEQISMQLRRIISELSEATHS